MQGFNMGRYVPPDVEGTLSGNALHGKKALGSRANKSSQGILTVRFEMPYPIWCTTCPKPTIIGQGVRFNAEKQKIGAYYSTPIFSFRMKHTPCGGTIEIRTDPQNTAYIVHSGARKRDTGEDRVAEGDVVVLTEEEREARRNNAFASLEGKVDDRRQLEGAKKRLDELQERQEQQWEDPYARNRELRRAFRAGRQKREEDAKVAGALQDKLSLGLDLLPEHEDDARRASLVEYGTGDDAAEQALHKAIAKPLFASSPPSPSRASSAQRVKQSAKSKSTTASRRLKAEAVKEKRRNDLVAEIRGNTRVKMDPFLVQRGAGAGGKVAVAAVPWKAVGVKRKREGLEEAAADGGPGLQKVAASALVNYDSD